jgi:hypothetical protein
MVRQARDRQFEYLNAQQGALEDESDDEYWSNPQRGHDPNEMSDLVSLRCDVKTITIDIDETLMQINITGSADLQKIIRLLCNEYWSNPQRGHDPSEMSDLVRLRCDVKTIIIDIEETLIDYLYAS